MVTDAALGRGFSSVSVIGVTLMRLLGNAVTIIAQTRRLGGGKYKQQTSKRGNRHGHGHRRGHRRRHRPSLGRLRGVTIRSRGAHGLAHCLLHTHTSVCVCVYYIDFCPAPDIAVFGSLSRHAAHICCSSLPWRPRRHEAQTLSKVGQQSQLRSTARPCRWTRRWGAQRASTSRNGMALQCCAMRMCPRPEARVWSSR